MDQIHFWGLDLKDWVIVFATIAGPILAVQAQKAIERIRDGRYQKNQIFEQLMATRQLRLSPQHVQALNMIDLAFYGGKTLLSKRTSREQKVLNCWNEYHDHLCIQPPNDQVWIDKSSDFLTNLLSAMAEDLGYKFDNVQIKRGSYLPIAHSAIEEQLLHLRHATLEALNGNKVIKMEVVSFPSDESLIEANQQFSEKLGSAISDGALRVEIKAPEKN